MSNLRSDKRWVLWMLEQSQRAKGARTRRRRAGGLGAALTSLKGLLAVSEIGRISNHVYLILQFQLLQILEQAKPLLLFTHKQICSSLIYCTYSWTNRASWVGNTARTAISLSQLGFNHWPRHDWSHPAEKSPHHPITLPVLSVKAPARAEALLTRSGVQGSLLGGAVGDSSPSQENDLQNAAKPCIHQNIPV